LSSAFGGLTIKTTLINVIKIKYFLIKLATKMQKKSLDSSSDETQTFEKEKIELANLRDVTI
jgi:hypothetical protein